MGKWNIRSFTVSAKVFKVEVWDLEFYLMVLYAYLLHCSFMIWGIMTAGQVNMRNKSDLLF